MPELLEDISQIVQEMHDLKQQAQETGLQKTLCELYKAVSDVGQSSSKSWLGYQANVYYRNFRIPAEGAYFNKRQGLRNKGNTRSRTSGDWVEYDSEQVMKEINHRAGDPNIETLLSFKQRADVTIRNAKTNLLSIIDIEINRINSPFLIEQKYELSKLATQTESDLVNAWRPTDQHTNDLEAIQQGWKTPPHLQIGAKVQSINSTAQAITTLEEIANQAKLHISRQHRDVHQASSTANKVFVGHGRSPIWRELKDFIEHQLELPVEEFNRIPTAGSSITDRLSEIVDSAIFAFLVMTGEDEQPSGELRPRENVVHEAGLFQGRLGFKKAIVLLEEDCEKFSNNAGLIHINFPKGNIRAAFQDVREVLEREEILNGGISP